MAEREHHKRARGGRTEAERKSRRFMYDAKGAPEAHEAADETPDFKKGGRTKKKETAKERKRHEAEGGRKANRELERERETGHAEGHKGKMRGDKRPRRATGGRTPYSSGHASRGHEDDRSTAAHESLRPEPEDD